MFAEDEAELLPVTATTPNGLERMVRQRVRGIPLEQILGWAEFAGLRICHRTWRVCAAAAYRLLLEQALRLAPPQPVVVELCCGSGALALAVASTLQQVELYATDIDPAAVRCAGRNRGSLPGLAGVLEGDLYEPLPTSLAGRVRLLLANAPTSRLAQSR